MLKSTRFVRVLTMLLLCLANVLFYSAGSVSAAKHIVGGELNQNLAALPGTTTSSLSLVPTFESIGVYAAFSGDGNANNQAQLSYRPTGTAEWIQGMNMTVDRRVTVTGGTYSYTNPYVNQWRASLLGLQPKTSYDVKVTFTDPDGVAGSVTMTQTVSTMNDTFPSSGGNYYVAPTGSDSNPGTLAQPFKTIGRGVTGLKAGDTLNIRGGTYPERVVLAQLVGSPTNWITIQAYASETPIIDGRGTQTHNFYIGGWADPRTQYVRIKGLRLTNAQSAIEINERASNIVIEGNTMDGFVEHGVRIGAWNVPNSLTTRIVVQGNNIVRNKLPGANGGTNIGLYSNGGGHVIRNNVIKDITGNPTVQSSPSHLDCIGGGPDFQLGTGLYRDTDVYNNTISDCNDDAIQADGTAMNVRIWGNYLQAVKTNWSGISTAPTMVGPVYVFRNLVIGQLTDALKQGQNSTGAQFIYHNTFYTTQSTADGFFQTDPGLKNLTVMNNILHSGRYIIEYSEPSSSSGNRFNYNNLSSSDGGRYIFMNGSNLSYSTFRGLGYETNGLNLNATNEFVNAGGGDFHLKTGSQLIDRGAVIQGFNDPRSRWAFRGSGPDLGVYEQQSGTAPTPVPTSAPTQAPTLAPTKAPTQAPTLVPNVPAQPTATQAPTNAPTAAPTKAPTAGPTATVYLPLVQKFEAETMQQTSGSFAIFTDSLASAGKAIAFRTDATLSTQVTVTTTSDLIVVARGIECAAIPASMSVLLDEVNLGTTVMYNSPWKEIAYPKVLTPGTHTVTIKSTNTYSDGGSCNRQVRADVVIVR